MKRYLQFIMCLACVALGSSSIMAQVSPYTSPLKVDREYTGVHYLQDAALAQSIGLPKPLTGKGVLLVVGDGDMETSHVAFRDAETGLSRFIRMYYYDATLSDPEEIMEHKALFDTHGTHVMGIAAGAYDDGRGMQGIATGATLGFFEFSALNKALPKISALADSLNVPCVVSVSASNRTDMYHDGITAWSDAINSFTDNGNAPGRLFFLSVGNYGKGTGSPYFSHTFTTAGEKLRAFTDYESFLSFCAIFPEGAGKLAIEAYDTIQHKVVDNVIMDEMGEPLSNADATEQWITYEKRRNRTCASVSELIQIEEPNVVASFVISGEPGTVFESLDGDLHLRNGEGIVPNGIRPRYGLNCTATVESCISVGNMTARDYEKSGVMFHPGMIYGSSSWGIDDLGRKHPDVCAPGTYMMSSVTTTYGEGATPSQLESQDVWCSKNPLGEYPARDYYWGCFSGTSMATPYMAGVATLLLEYDPTITANRLRNLIRQTNDWTEACENDKYGPLHAGCGILNAKRLAEALIAEKPTGVIDVTTTRPAVSHIPVDLLGRPVDPATYKGIYIMNGKKYIGR
ncbi:MAG: S8 family serine peptidase [Bacteroidales bacterium]|nr:S8 family serine peptidase [Bacteroidales bacterium]